MSTGAKKRRVTVYLDSEILALSSNKGNTREVNRALRLYGRELYREGEYLLLLFSASEWEYLRAALEMSCQGFVENIDRTPEAVAHYVTAGANHPLTAKESEAVGGPTGIAALYRKVMELDPLQVQALLLAIRFGFTELVSYNDSYRWYAPATRVAAANA